MHFIYHHFPTNTINQIKASHSTLAAKSSPKMSSIQPKILPVNCHKNPFYLLTDCLIPSLVLIWTANHQHVQAVSQTYLTISHLFYGKYKVSTHQWPLIPCQMRKNYHLFHIFNKRSKQIGYWLPVCIGVHVYSCVMTNAKKTMKYLDYLLYQIG